MLHQRRYNHLCAAAEQLACCSQTRDKPSRQPKSSLGINLYVYFGLFQIFGFDLFPTPHCGNVKPKSHATLEAIGSPVIEMLQAIPFLVEYLIGQALLLSCGMSYCYKLLSTCPEAPIVRIFCTLHVRGDLQSLSGTWNQGVGVDVPALKKPSAEVTTKIDYNSRSLIFSSLGTTKEDRTF